MLRGGKNAQIDSLYVESGEFKMQTDGVSSIMLTVVYLNSKIDKSLGTCRVPETALSTEALEAFDTFLQLAERDFGKVLFDGMVSETTEAAIENTGLPKGLGELG